LKEPDCLVGDDKAAAAPSHPPGHRFYNWNTTHFFPDLHKVDIPLPSFRHQHRRHSEPDCSRVGHRGPPLANSEGATSSRVSSTSDVTSSADDNVESDGMPLTELSVWVTPGQELRSRPNGQATIVDISSDSSSSSDEETNNVGSKPKLDARRHDVVQPVPWDVVSSDVSTARDVVAPRRKLSAPNSQLTIDIIDGGISRMTYDRPSVRLKEVSEKRREFLRQRCRSQGWDLENGGGDLACVDVGSGLEKSLHMPRMRTSISRSQEDMRYIEQPATEWSVRGAGTCQVEDARIDVKNRIRQFESSTSKRREDKNESLDSDSKCFDSSNKTNQNRTVFDVPLVDDTTSKVLTAPGKTVPRSTRSVSCLR
jgi:hypothetical protein